MLISPFAGVNITIQPIPVIPAVHYNMGGMQANHHNQIVSLKDMDARFDRFWSGNETIVPSIFSKVRHINGYFKLDE